MPIRRGSDGEIVEEPTEPNRGQSETGSGSSSSDTNTESASTDSAARDDSLFGPGKRGTGDRLEDPTVPIDRRRRDDGKTRILAPRRNRMEESRSALEPDDPMLDPPVGWLVVVRGPGQGRVLTLGNGMNVIGRGETARVRIDFGDDTIARANHARLAYEPRSRVYLLSHGEGANLTYVDGRAVTATIEIESGAMIEMGATTLRFQAFCTKEFDWPDLDD